MSIQEQYRGEVRNIWTESSTPFGRSFLDLSEVANNYIRGKLEKTLVNVDKVFLNETEFSNGGGETIKTDFYPLDKGLSELEAEITLLAVESRVVGKPLKTLLNLHVENIKNKIRAKELSNPGQKISIYFSPADDIAFIGSRALYGYAFLQGLDGKYHLETESSFTVVANT